MAKFTTVQYILILTIITICNSHSLNLLNGRRKGGFVGVPKSKHQFKLPEDEWFEQKLDHFEPTDGRTWKQRFFTNGTFFTGDGPVFLMIGGEGQASPIWMVEGQWINFAQKFKALCFQLEHRFYGKSHPTSNTSVENLKYLSSEQALADLAYFRVAMSQKFKVTSNKWIVFGGSYPGSLAAWFRLKYPHLADGAIASSAPLYAVIDFKEYLGVVTTAMTEDNPQCPKSVQQATAEIEQLLLTPVGVKKLKDMFRLCTDIDITNKFDIYNLFSSLAGNFMGVVQYNKDNRQFEGAVGANITVTTLCNLMTSKSGSPLENYGTVNSLLLQTYNQTCLDYSYKKMVDQLRNTTWDTEAAEGGRQWLYQTCTEFGYYQTSDLPDQPFGHMFPLSFSTQQCSDIFGKSFNMKLLETAVERTNNMYGGQSIRVTRVVFANGSIDPWHALGITNVTTSSENVVIYIHGTAHCADMYPTSDTDLPQLANARNQIQSIIASWIQSKKS